MSNEQRFINEDGDEFYYSKDGKLHREDGPAAIYASGCWLWYFDGHLHRTGGPCCEYTNGAKYWYRHGVCHRLSGPAVIWSDGTEHFYVDGKHMSKEDHENNPYVIAYKIKKEVLELVGIECLEE